MNKEFYDHLSGKLFIYISKKFINNYKIQENAYVVNVPVVHVDVQHLDISRIIKSF
jgi:hypothetical protein